MAMEHVVTLEQHDALPLVLGCLNQDVKAICSLLCVCKSMRTSIAQQCRCQLPLEYSTQSLPQVELFAGWLRQWAGLAKTLELEWNRISLQDVETHLQDALQQAEAAGAEAAGGAGAAGAAGAAAAEPAGAAESSTCTTHTGPLQIKSLKANVAGPLLLGQLPANTLTCLELGHVVDYAGVCCVSRLCVLVSAALDRHPVTLSC